MVGDLDSRLAGETKTTIYFGDVEEEEEEGGEEEEEAEEEEEEEEEEEGTAMKEKKEQEGKGKNFPKKSFSAPDGAQLRASDRRRLCTVTSACYCDSVSNPLVR